MGSTAVPAVVRCVPRRTLSREGYPNCRQWPNPSVCQLPSCLPRDASNCARDGRAPQNIAKNHRKAAFFTHRSKNGRTDGFLPARTEIWPARNGQLPARIEFWPHEPENGRTKRFIAARNWNCSAQIDFEVAGSEFCPHEVLADGHQ